MDIDWFLVEMKYHYCYEESPFGDRCDIFAEVCMEEDSFTDEIARVSELFTEENARWDGAELVTLQQGAFTCLLRYKGMIPIADLPEIRGYDDVYYLFAYDPETYTVRYLYFYSEIGMTDSAYYYTLQWESEPAV